MDRQEARIVERIHRRRPVPDLSALPDEALLARAQVAELSGFSVQALKKWARESRGPQFVMLEGRPRYRARDVRVWIGQNV